MTGAIAATGAITAACGSSNHAPVAISPVETAGGSSSPTAAGTVSSPAGGGNETPAALTPTTTTTTTGELAPIPMGIVPVTGSPRTPVPQSKIELPWVHAFMATDSWRSIQVERERFDWSFLDAEVNRAAAADKGIVLRVRSNYAAQAGVATANPDWIFDDRGGACGRRAVDDGSSRYEAYEPWTDCWKDAFSTLVTALGARFEPSRWVRAVVVSGYNLKHEELTTRNQNGTWDRGYDEAAYIGNIKWTLALFTKAFPTKLLLLRGTAFNVPHRRPDQFTVWDRTVAELHQSYPSVSIGETGLADDTDPARDPPYIRIKGEGGLRHHFQVGKLTAPTAEAALRTARLAVDGGAHHLEVGDGDWSSDTQWQAAASLSWAP